MTFYQGLAAVLLKVWAATFIVYGVLALVQSAVTWTSFTAPAEPGQFDYRTYNLIISAVNLALGVGLWVFAAPFGKRIGRAMSAPAPELGATPAQLVAIGVFLIGVFYLVEYLPKALSATAMLLYENGKATDAARVGGVANFSSYDWSNLAGNWAVVILALVLALRARDVGRLFGWLRHAGVSKADAG